MKRYCTTCGTEMRKKLVPLKIYHPYTGKPEVDVSLTCPKARFWKLGHEAVILTRVYTNEGQED